MFETAELGQKLSKDEWRKKEPALRERLLQAQERVLELSRFPIIVLINGVDGSGKGDTVNLLHEWMDPRHLRTHTYSAPTDEEKERPHFWRYWRTLPPKGLTGIAFGSWYTEPILERAHRRIDKDAFDHRLQRITAFERMLTDDGAVLVKLWFHLSKRAQRERFDELLGDKRTRWRVTKDDLHHHELYDRFRDVSEHALYETSQGNAPWVLIEAADRRFTSVATGEALLAAIEKRLAAVDAAKASPPPRKPARATKRKPPPLPPTILDTVDLSAHVGESSYEHELERLQGRLNKAFGKLRDEGKSCTVVFEGWDAAGKGGAIRRVTAALDARDYQIIPIAAPTDEERAQHYLWRFWRHIPRAGKMTVYDRSWYGRVLVERVERFAHEEEWRRAYAEINDFEEQLSEGGTVLCKFWLHIDPDEQMRRFRERERTSFKRFKIGPEDYRNRARWNDYVLAVHDMVAQTSTGHAPWTLVPANDKRAGRLEVLRTLCRRIEQAL